jgi:hypothetical protein
VRYLAELSSQRVTRATRSNGAGTGLGIRIAALNDKTGLDAMERGSIVKACASKFDVAGNMVWRGFRVELELDNTAAGRDDRLLAEQPCRPTTSSVSAITKAIVPLRLRRLFMLVVPLAVRVTG